MTPAIPEQTPIRFATLVPSPGGFGLYQFSEWQADEFCPSLEDLDDYCAENGYDPADGPGDHYRGLIQDESDAEGWLIPTDSSHPIAWMRA